MIYKDGKPVIEKGVPVPKSPHGFGRTSPIMDVARAMEVGDSILVPAAAGKQLSGNMARATAYKFTQRRDGDNIRIWRIE